ncbi:MAG: hypothetical protein JJU36_03410 [Phycisphaeraceae bacterium]|nr:hypothetical protein [Phycisphaeraceae bacterium]
MKRYGNLWDSVTSWENLLLAARKARRSKRDRSAVQRFEFGLETELLALRAELLNGTYRPGTFSTHWISRPKPRLISAAPYPDRVVHHALMNVLEPILDRHMHPASFACRKGKGTHAAADRLQALMRRHRYVVHCDIRKYFPSIDHEILKGLFRRIFKDRQVLGLMDLIVDHSNEQEPVVHYFPGDDLFEPHRRRRGLPIGNLTSQWFANWYLTGLDHLVTSHLGIGDYVRYCDDFVLLADDRRRLAEAMAAIQDYLQELRLRVHEERVAISPVRAGARFVGFRVWPTHRMICKDNVRAFRRRVKALRAAYAADELTWDDIKPRLAGWIGHARQASSVRLLRRLSREWTFARGGAGNGPCCARRQLEQQSTELPVVEPQQERARQLQQQYRVSGRGALLRQSLPARNRRVHGPGERGGESPGPAPESSGRLAGRPNPRCGAGRVWYPSWRTPRPALCTVQGGASGHWA